MTKSQLRREKFRQPPRKDDRLLPKHDLRVQSLPRGFSWPIVASLLIVSAAFVQLIFPPIDLWLLSFVCLAPWLIVVPTMRSAKLVYLLSYALGLSFFLIHLRWLMTVTVPGGVVFAFYLAAYFPLAACPIRHAARRRRLPLAVVAPIVWVATELARAHIITGFPWFFLGHTVYRVLPLIQISDLLGAYGPTFLVVAINGAVADVVIGARRGRRRDGAWGMGFAAIFLAATLAYGYFRLSQETIDPGPTVAVLQQDFPNFTDRLKENALPSDRLDRYAAMLQSITEDADIYLLPETPWTMAINQEYLSLSPEDPYFREHNVNFQRFSRRSFHMLQAQATRTGKYVVSGGISIVPTPFSVRSEDLKYNSAFVFSPDGSTPERYDKNHVVLFGEQVPFRFGRLRFLYLWMNSMMPFGADGYEYSIVAGTELKTFTIQTNEPERAEYTFGIPICYEDVMPYVCRGFVTDAVTGEKRADFLLNISNDGWFLHSDELPQHLAICAFRAVENRVYIARAVNTGISGFIDSNGRIFGLVTRDGRSHGPDISGYSVAEVGIDRRHSFYSRYGDVFATACLLLGGVLYLDYFLVRATWRGNQSTQEA